MHAKNFSRLLTFDVFSLIKFLLSNMDERNIKPDEKTPIVPLGDPGKNN